MGKKTKGLYVNLTMGTNSFNNIYTIMINKNNLRNKHVSYIGGDGKFHTDRVVRISGNTLTVKNANGTRKRIHPEQRKIFGVYFRNKLVGIDWGRGK
jgi:hypothetical protein